jgi:sialate O-acetylesterase
MKKLFPLIVFILLFSSLYGKVRMPNIFADNMVLQRNTTVKLWGWANPGEKVILTAEWQKAPVTAVTDASGKWLIKIKTTNAGGPYKISVKGENEISFSNVLLGEVWICSGQSNMEFTIKMFGGWDKTFKNEKEDFLKNDYSKIRFMQVEKATSATPLDTCKAKWMIPDITNTEEFSATAFFFGKELYNKLKVPIGLVSTNWGGTPAEAWTEKSFLEKANDLQYYLRLPLGGDPNQPAKLYNAMIHPLINYTIRGAIWYQGEANVDNSNLYTKLFSTMIKCWRDKWQLGDFPFYFVQIAPYNYGDNEQSSAFLREAQMQTLPSVKNIGMASTMDIGNPNDIHPTNKTEVGRRLALWAFAKTYNVKVPAFSGPVYKSFKAEGNKIRVNFEYAQSGLMVKGNKLTGLKIADASMKFVDADYEIKGSTLIAFNKDIAKPAAVRFAFTNTDSSNLYNKEGLPASSFRTDKAPFFKPFLGVIPVSNPEKGTLDVKLNCADSKAQIRYTTDGTEPGPSSPLYSKVIELNASALVTARAYKEGNPSLNKISFNFQKHLAFGKKVTYKNQFVARYASTKELALTDGIRGSENFTDGFWQGFQQTDFEAVIDLGEAKTINQISIGFLRAMASWIFPPKKVEFYISDDGINFTKKFEITNSAPADYGKVVSETYSANITGAKTRFVKVVAENQGIVPDWHSGKGGKAWLFADEIIVN